MTDDDKKIDVLLNGAIGSFSLDCAFQVSARGVTALFGPSGSGKTSVLRCIAGLNRMTGHVRIAGNYWQDSASGHFLPTHRRSIGYVFQEDNLFPHLDVRENLLIGAGRGTSPRVPHDDISEIMSLFGLEALLSRSVLGLSGGERQRVAMARALIKKPSLLLMDEPLSALDYHTKYEILPYLDRMLESLAIPMIYVSHDMMEVTRVADQVVLMANGRAVTSGATTSILEKVDLNGVVETGGAGAVVQAVVKEHIHSDHMTRLDVCGQKLSVPFMNASTGASVRIYINARDVSLATSQPSHISIRNTLEGHIISMHAIDGTAYVDTSIDIGGVIIRSQITRPALRDLSLKVGQKVYALIKSVTFDPRSLARG